jgi:uncharacterized membrane protein YhhN
VVVAFAVACAVGCGLLLWSERMGWAWGPWAFKPLASGCFVAAGLVSGALDTGYGLWVLTALVLSLVGDVLLIPGGRGPGFLAGIGSFLAAHVAYGAAFWSVGISGGGGVAAGLLAVLIAWRVWTWLRPHVDGVFRRAVPVYIAVIAGMLALAASASLATGRPSLCVGAALFVVSDLFVARDRFVAPGPVNGTLGLPLYFAAQLILAVSVSGSAAQ